MSNEKTTQDSTNDSGRVSARKKTPTYKCDNCGCMRYKPCTCAKAAGRTDKKENEVNG